MKAQFNNTLKLDKTAVNAPFMIEETSIGIVLDVTDEYFTVDIWDRFCGFEFNKKPFFVSSVYLSTKEQYLHDELMEIVADK